MEAGISKELLNIMSEFVASRMGLHFSGERLKDLERGIKGAAKEFGYDDPESCVRWLISSPLKRTQIEILAGHLTIGETYFFREKNCFEILEREIIPEILASKKEENSLRIWSAGCSTGEEAYSIAISLSRSIPNLKNRNMTLLATDINPRFLEKAREGIYGEWSFRNTPPWVKELYFRKIRKGSYSIHPQIRGMVTFAYLNLADDIYPSLLNGTNAMDIIFCRNALLYFAPDKASQVVQNFHHCLVNGGWLILSAVEASPSLTADFNKVLYPEVIWYRKEPQTVSQVRNGEAQLEFKLLDSQTLSVPKRFPIPKQTPGESKKKESAAELTELARRHANQGMITEALNCCEKAISLEKLNPALHYLRAILLQERGETERAITALKQVLYLDPNFAIAHFSLALLLQKQGLPEASKKNFENALQLLSKFPHETIIPESDGLTAGRLKAVIETIFPSEALA